LGRSDTSLGRRFFEEIRCEVEQRVFPIPAGKTVIEYASPGGDAGLPGAARCVRLKFGNPESVVD
jgi:glucokinase